MHLIRPSACARVPLGWWSLLPQDRTSICCLKLQRAVAEELSVCSLPVPKECEVSLGSFLRRPGDLLQDLAACASNDLVLFLLIRKGFSSHCFGRQLFGRHEVLLPAVHREHVGHQLPGYRQGGPILVPSLDFLLPEQGQLVGVPGCQLGGFHQHVLNVLVPLLGNRHAHHLVGRTVLSAA